MKNVPDASSGSLTGKKIYKKICPWSFYLLFFLGIVFAIWYFGSPQPHQEVKHQLFNTFDNSAPHKKLLTGIGKAKVSLLVGKKEDGLFQFVEHYANSLSKMGRTVYVSEYSS